jgi:formate dehydrogenase major subunit
MVKMKKLCVLNTKVSSVEVQKISNQFKTEVKAKENQAEVN